MEGFCGDGPSRRLPREASHSGVRNGAPAIPRYIGVDGNYYNILGVILGEWKEMETATVYLGYIGLGKNVSALVPRSRHRAPA